MPTKPAAGSQDPPKSTPDHRCIVHMCKLAAIAAFLLFQTLTAQTPSGPIRLEIKDPSGAPVEASSKVAGPLNSRFISDANGRYTLTGLPFGTYRIEISKAGFANAILRIDVQS